jgi:hypothetical protein
MPTSDFVDDAIDSIERDDTAHYILIVARAGSPKFDAYVKVETRRQLEWIRARLNRVIDNALSKLPE